MPVLITAQLFAGFAPLSFETADPAEETALVASLRALRFRPPVVDDRHIDILGAPTLYLSLTGRPEPMAVRWRFGKVTLNGLIADDAERQVLQWGPLRTRLIRAFLAGTSALEVLSAPQPAGARRIDRIPPGPTPDEQGAPCADAPSGTAFAAWIARSGSNNCYNFASDVLFAAGNPAHPGAGGGDPVGDGPSCEALRKALIIDGLPEIAPVPSSCPAGGHYVMVMRRHWQFSSDFHCLRLSADGCWTHKDGMENPRRTDDVHAEIAHIREAVFAYDWTFCGFHFAGPARRLSP